MSQIVVYDPNDPVVPNRVTAYAASANTPEYDSEPNKLVNPDLSALSGVIVKFWKRVGLTVVEMSQAEKDAIAAAEATAQVAAVRTGAKLFIVNFHADSLFQRAVASVILDELNILRGWTRDLQAGIAGASSLAQVKTAVASLPSLTDRTLAQVKSAINSRIDDGTVDN